MNDLMRAITEFDRQTGLSGKSVVDKIVADSLLHIMQSSCKSEACVDEVSTSVYDLAEKMSSKYSCAQSVIVGVWVALEAMCIALYCANENNGRRN